MLKNKNRNHLPFFYLVIWTITFMTTALSAAEQEDVIKKTKSLILKITTLNNYKDRLLQPTGNGNYSPYSSGQTNNRRTMPYGRANNEYSNSRRPSNTGSNNRINKAQEKADLIDEKVNQKQNEITQFVDSYKKLSDAELKSAIEFCVSELNKQFPIYDRLLIKNKFEYAKKRQAYYQNVSQSLGYLLDIYYFPVISSSESLLTEIGIKPTFHKYHALSLRNFNTARDDLNNYIEQEAKTKQNLYPKADYSKVKRKVTQEYYSSLAKAEVTDLYKTKLEYSCGLFCYIRMGDNWLAKSYEGEIFSSKLLVNVLGKSSASLVNDINEKFEMSESSNIKCSFQGFKVLDYNNETPKSMLMKFKYFVPPLQRKANLRQAGVVELFSTVQYKSNQWEISKEEPKIISYPSWTNISVCKLCNGKGHSMKTYNFTASDNPVTGEAGGPRSILHKVDCSCDGGNIYDRHIEQDDMRMYNSIRYFK